MIQIKNQWINGNKISLSYAESEKNNKNYLIVLLDTKENNKIFIEVQNESEFTAVLQQVKNQMQND
jgi:hypothetical protein